MEFTGKKKKKKSPKPTATTVPQPNFGDLPEVIDKAEEEGEILWSLVKPYFFVHTNDEEEKSKEGFYSMKFDSESSYTYEEVRILYSGGVQLLMSLQLVERIFGQIRLSRPENKTTRKMEPPQVFRSGTTRTVWANFPKICRT